ncbi:MAG TPA: hypothetical protein VIW64_16830 [Pyrinomonadaceae bacterium]
MALLIRNQAAFVEQIARNDQERLKLQVKSEDWQRKTEDWQRKTEDWQRKTEARLEKIESALIEMPNIILKAVLDQLPKAIKKEIGFRPTAAR